MKSILLRLYRATTTRAKHLMLSGLFITGNALADLPAIEQPTTGGGGGTYNTMMGYAKMGGLALGLLVSVGAFLAVAHAVTTSFHDVRKGKGTWTELLLYTVVGVILLLVVIYLATKASDIL
nr:TIGR03745 family integrating conjugative element membrane protein [Pantoea cypripedii]